MRISGTCQHSTYYVIHGLGLNSCRVVMQVIDLVSVSCLGRCYTMHILYILTRVSYCRTFVGRSVLRADFYMRLAQYKVKKLLAIVTALDGKIIRYY